MVFRAMPRSRCTILRAMHIRITIRVVYRKLTVNFPAILQAPLGARCHYPPPPSTHITTPSTQIARSIAFCGIRSARQASIGAFATYVLFAHFAPKLARFRIDLVSIKVGQCTRGPMRQFYTILVLAYVHVAWNLVSFRQDGARHQGPGIAPWWSTGARSKAGRPEHRLTGRGFEPNCCQYRLLRSQTAGVHQQFGTGSSHWRPLTIGALCRGILGQHLPRDTSI